MLSETMSLRIYSDGASRGNPGPSAVAYIILSEDGEPLRKYSKYLGIRTNNQAEYEALALALEAASELTSKEVVCYMDSELVAKQLSGEYKVRDPELKTLWLKIQELKRNFRRTTHLSVPRENLHIQEVDRMANQTLNRVSDRL